MAEVSSNKTIAKNTLYLYFRSFLMMAIGLFSSRVTLQALGVEDYGLYGAIGSIVAMFTIINGVLSAGTSRFLTFELGKGDTDRLKKTFSASFTMHVALAVVLFLLLETVGLWFVNHKMNIPEGRDFAANVVYQLSILTCMLSLTQVPYRASIIAHEKMDVYAYVGLIEAAFKLALIFVLLYVPFQDNLIAYAIILAAWNVGLQLWYRWYCYKRFPESHLMIVRDRSIYKGMLSYSLWDFVGQFIATGHNQGVNILINLFFGVTINAARAVAYQVESAVLQFSTNFTTALRPSITKSYARGDYSRFFQLIIEGGRYSFFLLFLVSLPIFIEAEYILKLWLVEVPESTLIFLRCVMFLTFIRIPSKPLIAGVHATGHVKRLNLTSGIWSASTYLPLVYIFYKAGLPAWTCFCVQGFNACVCSYLEARSLKKEIDYSMRSYYYEVYVKSIPVFLTAILPSVIPILLMEEGILRLIVTTVVSLSSAAVSIYYLGLSKSTRARLLSFAKSKINFSKS